MSDGTKIEWTDATWNPIVGCSVVSPGCTNCYAMRLAGTRMKHHPSRAGLTRDSKAGPVWTGEVRFMEQWLIQPLRWAKPRMIFVCAHADLFHEAVPDEWIDRIFAVMAMAPQHTFQVLTKRPERMREYLARHDAGLRWLVRCGQFADHGLGVGDAVNWTRQGLPNVWLGTSVEDQAAADARIPELLATPASVRFLSCEPLLGPVNFNRIPSDHAGADFMNPLRGHYWIDAQVPEQVASTDGTIDWVIGGGESGSGARPCDLAWLRSLRDQCAAAGVAFFAKQLGSKPELDLEGNVKYILDWPAGHVIENRRARIKLRDRHGGDMAEWPEDLRRREFPGNPR